MKNLIFLLIIISVGSPVSAQQDKKVDSKIMRVTVFLNKAQVTRQVKTRLAEGVTNLVISGLTAQLDQNTLQISTKGNFILLGINHQNNYLKEFATPGPLRLLNDSIEHVQRAIAMENARKQILDKEEAMLLNNQKIGGTDQNLPVNELKEMAEFFRTRLLDIAIARLKHEDKIRSLSEVLSKLQRQLQAENELSARSTSEIVISVSAKAATEAELELAYVVGNAGWQPSYDLRAEDSSKPLNLFYKANVFQSTGENWSNVRLKLSTANPTLGGLKPELQTWRLDFYQRPYYMKDKRMEQSRSAAPSQALGEVAATEEAETIADYVNVNQTSVNTEFDISIPYTVNSASKPTTVDIGRHELKAFYRYAAAPKLDADAFLMAGATGWSDFNLLPGEANVFFEGTFVGKTLIDPQSIKDTLYVSLGRDKRIVVKREKVKDFNSRAVVGLNQREAHGFEINVRNNLSEEIAITIEDHIPVSSNSQIEVTLLNNGGARFTAENGKLSWKLKLKPGETRKLLYQFEVRFPKDKVIAGLN